jgi:hypothetical protein
MPRTFLRCCFSSPTFFPISALDNIKAAEGIVQPSADTVAAPGWIRAPDRPPEPISKNVKLSENSPCMVLYV